MAPSAQARFGYLLLRAGVAFAFLYPPLNALLEPGNWLGYFPAFARSAAAALGIDDFVLLHVFGAIEIVLALWILSGWKIFWPSLATAALLVGIVVFNLPEFPVLFRDLSIAAMALSLAIVNLPLRRGGTTLES